MEMTSLEWWHEVTLLKSPWEFTMRRRDGQLKSFKGSKIG